VNQIQLQPIDKGNLSSKGALAVAEKPPLINKQRSNNLPENPKMAEIQQQHNYAIKELRSKNKLLEDQLTIADSLF